MTDRDAALAYYFYTRSWEPQSDMAARVRTEFLSGKRDGLRLVQAFTAHRLASTALLEAEIARLRETGQFLLDRLDDHENRMTSPIDAREWNGHVVPAVSRFRDALKGGQS